VGITLEQLADGSGPKHAILTGLVPPGEEPTLVVYGTLWCCKVTHYAAEVLTRRGKLELPSCLHFDPVFRKDRDVKALKVLRFVKPAFVEWLLGLPHGWTDLKPLDRECIEASRASLSPHGGLGVCASSPGTSAIKLRSMSLFSGCGALDYALLPWCTPAMYCEICPHAVKVLEARMLDKSLPKAPVFSDVRALTTDTLPKRIDIIVAGFPCVDVSKAGKKRGLEGSESRLVFEVLRVAQEMGVPMVFLENVDNFRFMTPFRDRVFGAFSAVGFEIQWASLAGTNVGSPQRRRRIFLLARRNSSPIVPFGPPLPQGPLGEFTNARPSSEFTDARLPFFREHQGLKFNLGRPPESDWMMTREDYAQNQHRLHMLGNAVIPQQANLAARIMSSPHRLLKNNAHCIQLVRSAMRQ
jgi:site-specific DNA-cytosine methylase